MARGMAGPSWNQIMMIGGLGLAGLIVYEIYVNQGTIQAAIQNALNPINPYQSQGYYCPGGGVPGPTGLCPNGTPAINSSQFNQIASMAGGCSDGSIVNPSTGRCANGTFPMSSPYGGYGLGGMGYPQTSVCSDGSMPNPVNGLCANGSYPSSVGTGVNNSLMNPYGAPQYVQPGITGGMGVPGTTTFTDPTTGQMYDPSTGMLLTPGGSFTTPNLASPYNSIFPYLPPLGQNYWNPPPSGPSIGVCSDQSTPGANGLCANGTVPAPSGLGTTPTTPSGQPMCSDGTSPNTQGICANGNPPVIGQVGQPTATQIVTANTTQPSGSLGCADGSTAGATGLCANGQPPTTSLPVGATANPSGQVPVTATPVAGQPTTITPTPAPAPVPVTTTTTQPVGAQPGAPGAGGAGGTPSLPTTTNTNQQNQRSRFGGGFRGYAGETEGAMISAQAFGYRPQNRSQASVTSYSSVRPKLGNSPITSELFGRRFYTKTPIYVSGIK